VQAARLSRPAAMSQDGALRRLLQPRDTGQVALELGDAALAR